MGAGGLRPTGAGGRPRRRRSRTRLQLTVVALLVLAVLAAALGSEHPTAGATYSGVASMTAPAVSFRVSRSGHTLLGLRLKGQLPGPCRGLTVPSGGTATIRKDASFALILPLRSGGARAGELIVVGAFGRDGHENGQLELRPANGLSSRCAAVVSYSTQTQSQAS